MDDQINDLNIFERQIRAIMKLGKCSDFLSETRANVLLEEIDILRSAIGGWMRQQSEK